MTCEDCACRSDSLNLGICMNKASPYYLRPIEFHEPCDKWTPKEKSDDSTGILTAVRHS